MEQPDQTVVTKLDLPSQAGRTEAPTSGTTVFDAKDVSIFYGSFRAVTGVSLSVYEKEITAFIGPSGCGKTTVLRTLNRLNDLIPTARVEGEVHYRGQSLYDPVVSPIAVRRRIGMVFQKPNPFPKSIYDNVAYGPRINGRAQQAEAGRDRRGLAASGRAVGRGQEPAEDVGAEPVRRAGTAAVHRAHARGRAGRRLDGRAMLGAGPDRYGRHRGPDEGDQVPVQHRHRHAQYAAGRAGQRPHCLLLGPARRAE